MAKIGRNDKCPCGSDIKYKKCCAQKNSAQLIAEKRIQQSQQRTLTSAIQRIQHDAANGQVASFEFGVFFFFANNDSNAWGLEMTGGDAIQLADNGKALSPPIVENSETIEVNWSHRYRVKEKHSLVLTAYKDEKEDILENAPVSEISSAMRRIKKRLSQKELDKLHIS